MEKSEHLDTLESLATTLIDSVNGFEDAAKNTENPRFEQLFRDARLGRIHPGNTLLTHELVGKMSLGINPDEQPRWG